MDGTFDGNNDDSLDGSKLGEYMASSNGCVLGTDEGIKISLPYFEVLGITLGDDDGISLGIDEGTELEFSDGFFDCSNEGNIECTLLGHTMVTDDGTEIGYFDRSFDGNNDCNID